MPPSLPLLLPLCRFPSLQIRSSRRVAQPSAGDEDVTSRLITDVAFKRFSDFALLDAKLRKNFPSLSNLPALPPKKMFGNLEPKFVERRRAELEAYLSVLVEHDGGPDEAGGAVGSQHLTLLQASQDLRAFVPQGYLKEQLEDLLRFEVIEVNTFGLNRSMQLTVQPHASGVLQFRDASGSGGLDSQTNKIVISVCDIAGVTEVEGSHVRCALSFYTDDKGASSNSTPARNPRSGAGANPSTAPSSVASVAASSYMAASSLSSTNTRLQLNPLCDWADPESTTAALEPTGSPSSSLNPSSAAAITARAKKKVLEFACFEDRHRFIRLCKWLRETAAAAAAAMSARRTSLSTASLSSSSFVGMDPSPSCIENHPTSTWASVFTTTWNQGALPTTRACSLAQAHTRSRHPARVTRVRKETPLTTNSAASCCFLFYSLCFSLVQPRSPSRRTCRSGSRRTAATSTFLRSARRSVRRR